MSAEDLKTRLLILLKKISVNELQLDQATWTLLFKSLKQHPKLIYQSTLTNSQDLMTSLFQLPVIETIPEEYARQSVLHFKEEYIQYIKAELAVVKKIGELTNSIMDLISRLNMLKEILHISQLFKSRNTLRNREKDDSYEDY